MNTCKKISLPTPQSEHWVKNNYMSTNSNPTVSKKCEKTSQKFFINGRCYMYWHRLPFRNIFLCPPCMVHSGAQGKRIHDKNLKSNNTAASIKTQLPFLPHLSLFQSKPSLPNKLHIRKNSLHQKHFLSPSLFITPWTPPPPPLRLLPSVSIRCFSPSPLFRE
jgi:hypothetical protein